MDEAKEYSGLLIGRVSVIAVATSHVGVSHLR